MKHHATLPLIDQFERFSLRFCCEDCGAFDDRREVCAEGYPTDEHRKRPLREGEPIVFCKAFESL